MHKEIKDGLTDDLGEFLKCMKPGLWLALIYGVAATGYHLAYETDNTAHAEPKAEQPAPPSNYAVNRFILK